MAACLAVTAPLEPRGDPVYRKPFRLVRVVFPVAAVFLAWDAIAIANGVWSFNARYVTGVQIPFGIPLEELVFFLVIPVCSVLTYACVESMLHGPRGDERRQAERQRRSLR